jgi:hypothetical protein
MQKIISLFARNYSTDRLVRDEVIPGAEWVIAGEGIATEKIDGTACLIDENGRLYKRYACWGRKVPPKGWVLAEGLPAEGLPCEGIPTKGKGPWPGWLPVDPTKPEDRWHIEAYCLTFLDFGSLALGDFPPDPGTYELVGPKVRKNPYKLDYHMLWRHGSRCCAAPRTYAALKEWFELRDIEGIVWHHPDGRRVKIKKKDFGLHFPR